MDRCISIRPSKDIRTNYAGISALTRENPVAITVNGKEDTVLLSHEDFREQIAYISELEAKIAELDHWADKPETKAIVDNLIRDTLWAELPESYDEISITTYRKEIYEYIYLRYKTAA
mgnify:CR=1 FL=1